MKLLPLIASSALVFSFAACAGVAPPKADEMARLPTVRFGAPAPSGQDFVTFFPAGTPLPVVASVDGSLFEKGARSELTVSLKRDVYVFRQWVSFDGKTWQRGSELVDSKVDLKLPGVADGRNPGALSAAFNLK